ncbi:uncharacterized protein [Nicotiana tomentosiformis]|uniref:uncharacterized protein n=1 Tax=Nicotiana tomentosiformis TaxID=4098 RepID=UPI00388C6534
MASTTRSMELVHIDLCGPMGTMHRSGNQLASIRFDYGTELENAKFSELCDERGIDHNFSAPRTPQQNRVIEKKNRTLEEMARTMLLARKFDLRSDEGVFLGYSSHSNTYKEQDDEEIGLIRNSNGETTVQPKVTAQEITGDGTGPSTYCNLTGGTNQQGTDPQTLRKIVHEPIPQQQNQEGTSKEIDTPIATSTKLDLNEPGSSIGQKMYRGMIGSLFYRTASRLDIVFSVGLCASF